MGHNTQAGDLHPPPRGMTVPFLGRTSGSCLSCFVVSSTGLNPQNLARPQHPHAGAGPRMAGVLSARRGVPASPETAPTTASQKDYTLQTLYHTTDPISVP